MIKHINQIANSVQFLFCLWAVLDKRCMTKWLGTLALSLVALSAFIHVVRSECFGMIAPHLEMLLNVAVAFSVSWYWLRWRKGQCNCAGKVNHAPD